MNNKKQVIEGITPKRRQFIVACVQEFRHVLCFDHWEVDIKYMKDDQAPDQHGGQVAMSMDPDHRYLQSVLKIYPWILKDWVAGHQSDTQIAEMVAHEVAHLATAHFMHMAVSIYKDEGEMRDAFESTTTIIGRLVYRLAKIKRVV